MIQECKLWAQKKRGKWKRKLRLKNWISHIEVMSAKNKTDRTLINKGKQTILLLFTGRHERVLKN